MMQMTKISCVDDLITNFPFVEVDPPVSMVRNILATPSMVEVMIPSNAIVFRITKKRSDSSIEWSGSNKNIITTSNDSNGNFYVSNAPKWVPCSGLKSIFVGGDNSLCSIEFFIGN